jgi:hypothetical protein
MFSFGYFPGIRLSFADVSEPIEEILMGTEKAVRSLPVEKAEEARQE